MSARWLGVAWHWHGMAWQSCFFFVLLASDKRHDSSTIILPTTREGEQSVRYVQRSEEKGGAVFCFFLLGLFIVIDLSSEKEEPRGFVIS